MTIAPPITSRHATDPLSEVLHRLRLEGAFYCRSELTAPWGLYLPEMPGCLWFHVVTSGWAALTSAELEAPLELKRGDLLLLNRGPGHVLRTDDDVDTPDVTTLPHDKADQRYAVLRYGNGGPLTTLVCGVVRLDALTAADLLPLLPPVIHLDSLDAPNAEWLTSTLRLMAVEAAQDLPGGETIVTRLCDILVIKAIRWWLASNPAARSGWLGAARDSQIGRAIAAIHRDPGHPWSVVELAEAAAMSRSAFSARFTELVGESPGAYTTRVRMRLAAQVLCDEAASVAEVAHRLGYSSEAAFSRAFKRHTGESPGRFRRQSGP